MNASRRRPAAEASLRRLLALVPWVARQEGPRIAEICDRFGCTEAQLVEDLELLFMCGVYPYTPDTLIEVTVDEDRVWIRYADYFARPLRLTPSEGLALLAAGTALLSVPGSDQEGPLARGLAKLAAALGVSPEETMGVDLGRAEPELLSTLQRAAATYHQVEVDYYSYGRDEWAKRTIEPHRVFNAAGQWYVDAWCHSAVGERVFRLDRMRAADLLESTFEPRLTVGTTETYSPRPDDPVVVLETGPEARWVAEQYPNEGVEETAGGGVRVRLRVSERAWLERLLLRLGPRARVVDGDATVSSAAAARLLARYGVSVSPS